MSRDRILNPFEGVEIVDVAGHRVAWAPSYEELQGISVPVDRWLKIQNAPKIKPNRKIRRMGKAQQQRAL